MSELSPDLQAKYPTAKHAPLLDCSHCHGTGERWYESKSPYSRSGWKPCICIFIEHQHLPLVQDVIRTVIEQDMGKRIPIQVDPTLPDHTIKIGDSMLVNIKPE